MRLCTCKIHTLTESGILTVDYIPLQLSVSMEQSCDFASPKMGLKSRTVLLYHSTPRDRPGGMPRQARGINIKDGSTVPQHAEGLSRQHAQARGIEVKDGTIVPGGMPRLEGSKSRTVYYCTRQHAQARGIEVKDGTIVPGGMPRLEGSKYYCTRRHAQARGIKVLLY